MKKNSFVIISLMILIFLLLGCLSGCSSKERQQKSLRSLLETYQSKAVSISMWNSDKSKAILEEFIVAEANEDYLLVKQQEEGKEKSIVIPFSNITNIILTETPPIIVLNDQIALTGFGETIDSLGYVGSRIDRIRSSSTKNTEQ